MFKKSLLFIAIFVIFTFTLSASPMKCEDFFTYKYKNFITECFTLPNKLVLHTYHFDIDLEGMRLSALVFPIIQEKLNNYILIRTIEKDILRTYRKLIYNNASVEMNIQEQYVNKQLGNITKQTFVITWSK